jgi:hypothetical protein
MVESNEFNEKRPIKDIIRRHAQEFTEIKHEILMIELKLKKHGDKLNGMIKDFKTINQIMVILGIGLVFLLYINVIFGGF